MHTPTLLIMATILMGIVTAVMVAMWYFYRRIPGLLAWALSYLSGFLLCAVVLTRGQISEAWFVIDGQVLSFLMAYLNLVGARAYIGRPAISHARAAGMGAALVVLALHFTIVQPNPGIRFAVVSAVTGLLFILGARVLATGNVHRFPARYIFASASGAHGLFLLIRPLLFNPGKAGLFDPSYALTISQIIVLESIVAMTLLAFGSLMLANEHSTTELRRLAERDSLTSVFNSRTFLTLLDKAMSRARRKKLPLAVLLLDLDHFKSINDTWGHKAGDDALRHFVGIANGCMRNEDVIGRMGGEEFAIFLSDTDLTEAHGVAERMRALVAAHPATTAEGTIPLTVSIGVTLALAGEATDALLHRADVAMYQAKRKGRDRIETILSDADLRTSTSIAA